MSNKKKTIVILSVLILVIAVIAISYALSKLTLEGKKTILLSVKNLEVLIDENESDVIKIENAIPVSDEEGSKNSPYKFSIQNNGSRKVSYSLYLEQDSTALNDCGESCEVMDSSFISYQLTKDNEIVKKGTLANVESNLLLEDIEIGIGKIQDYELTLWMNYSADNSAKGKYYFGRIRLDARELKNKTFSNILLTKYTNDASITNYNSGDKTKMYAFQHTAGSQQSGWTDSELTDYRYIGTIPNNYVSFNNELWRIVGVFTVENELGEKEARVKIVRNSSIGNLAWDTNNTVKWYEASLKTMLNSGDYYNRVGTYASNGLTEEAKEMIGNTKWYLGGTNTNIHGAESYYAFERGIEVDAGRNTNWIGKVSLLYPSDYAYTYAYGVNATCYNNTSICDQGAPNQSWLFNQSLEWFLATSYNSANGGFFVNAAGAILCDYDTTSLYAVRPNI